jgi:hypothetical protein
MVMMIMMMMMTICALAPYRLVGRVPFPRPSPPRHYTKPTTSQHRHFSFKMETAWLSKTLPRTDKSTWCQNTDEIINCLLIRLFSGALSTTKALQTRMMQQERCGRTVTPRFKSSLFMHLPWQTKEISEEYEDIEPPCTYSNTMQGRLVYGDVHRRTKKLANSLTDGINFATTKLTAAIARLTLRNMPQLDARCQCMQTT